MQSEKQPRPTSTCFRNGSTRGTEDLAIHVVPGLGSGVKLFGIRVVQLSGAHGLGTAIGTQSLKASWGCPKMTLHVIDPESLGHLSLLELGYGTDCVCSSTFLPLESAGTSF